MTYRRFFLFLFLFLFLCSGTLAGCPSAEPNEMLDGGAVLRDGGSHDPDGGAEAPTCGPAGTSCDDEGAACETDAERCVCQLGAGLSWACEPVACDVGEPLEGEACSGEEEGLHCDTGFERYGNVCLDGTWVRCRPLRLDVNDGIRVWCPEEAPAEGDPCCVVTWSISPPPDECPYDGGTFRCALDDRWVRVDTR